MPSRRAVLATLALTAGAGCSSLPGTGSPQRTTTGATTDRSMTDRTTASSPGTDSGRSIFGVDVQRSYVGILGGHHMYVRAEPGRQYALVRTDAEQGTWPNTTVTLDGTAYARRGPSMTLREYETGPSISVVSLPLDRSPEAGSVTVGGTTRELSAETLERLADPPAFEVQSTSIPESVPRDRHLDVSLTVAHRGGRDEAFRANVANFTSQPTILERRMTAGETATVAASLSVYGDPGTEHRVAFDWGYGSEGRAVTLEASGTTAAATATTTVGGS